MKTYREILSIHLLSVIVVFGMSTININTVNAATSENKLELNQLQLTGDSAVQIRWNDPMEFTELRQSQSRWNLRDGKWVEKLATHLRKQVEPYLSQGDKVDITITDITLAGSFEPWQGAQWDQTRFMRDIYPPRIRLEYRWQHANGEVIEEQQNIADLSYLWQTGRLGESDPLRYEKRLLTDWARREFKSSNNSLSKK